MKKFIYWLPRILAILLIIFISLFALDVFTEPQWFLALLIHLIPSFLLIIVTAIAWQHESIGGLIFISLGLIILIFSRLEAIIVSLPVIIIGTLFLIRKKIFT